MIGTENPLSQWSNAKNIISEELTTLPIHGVFIAIGHSPNSGFVKEFIHTDSDGYIITQPGTTKLIFLNICCWGCAR